MASDPHGHSQVPGHEGAEEAPIFAVAAEFTDAAGLLAGVRAMAPRGFGALETHTPVPIEGLSQALGVRGSLTPIAVGGAAVGFALMMGGCIYATAYDYVFDIGGRPLVSWPAFVVPSLSFAMLTGAMAAYLAMLVANRLPQLNHPSFNIAGFTRATQDRFFLTISPTTLPLDLDAIDDAFGALAIRPVAVSAVQR